MGDDNGIPIYGDAEPEGFEERSGIFSEIALQRGYVIEEDGETVPKGEDGKFQLNSVRSYVEAIKKQADFLPEMLEFVDYWMKKNSKENMDENDMKILYEDILSLAVLCVEALEWIRINEPK